MKAEEFQLSFGLSLFAIIGVLYIFSFEFSARYRHKVNERFDCNYRWEKIIGCRGSYHMALISIIFTALVWIPSLVTIWNYADRWVLDSNTLKEA